MAKRQYYDPSKILKHRCNYNVVLGERSNGKTYAVLYDMLERHVKSEYTDQGVIIRRWDTDFEGATGAGTSFAMLTHNGRGANVVKELTGGLCDTIRYRAGAYALGSTGSKGFTQHSILAYGMSIVRGEHYKSASLPHVKSILFDEMCTRRQYLPNECTEFQALISTIVRDRDDVTIWMVGNTVDIHCPYFREMGLYKVKTMEQGTIDVYECGQTRIAVEYVGKGPSKRSDVYFGFDNPHTRMITTGSWETDTYPRLREGYDRNDVVFRFFVKWDGDTVQCDVVNRGADMFIFCYIKSDPETRYNDLVYSPEYDTSIFHRRRITVPLSETERAIYALIRQDKVFYASNMAGEILRNYLKWCNKM